MNTILDVTHITSLPVAAVLPVDAMGNPSPFGYIAVAVEGDWEVEGGATHGIVVKPYTFNKNPKVFIFGMWNWYDLANDLPGSVVTLNYEDCMYTVTHLEPEEGYTNAFEHLGEKVEIMFHPVKEDGQ